MEQREKEQRVIEMRALTKEYKVGEKLVKALDGVDITIERGEFVAIMGPSGSGKSTVMNLIGCLDRASSGSYFLNGVDVLELDEEELAELRNREIGFVFQSFNLLPRYTAWENVALPLIYFGSKKEERERRAKEALEVVGLKERVNHRPSQLSGGERQRVAIARALINNPSLILADEPTGNLDSATAKEIMELFTTIYKRGGTVVVVTHEEEVANWAERVIKLRDGVVESDVRMPKKQNESAIKAE